MNGASTEPSLRMIKPPKIRINIKIGKTQYFLRLARNLIN